MNDQKEALFKMSTEELGRRFLSKIRPYLESYHIRHTENKVFREN